MKIDLASFKLLAGIVTLNTSAVSGYVFLASLYESVAVATISVPLLWKFTPVNTGLVSFTLVAKAVLSIISVKSEDLIVKFVAGVLKSIEG